MCYRIINVVSVVLLVLTPSLVLAGEGIDVAFTVQEIKILDTIKSRLSANAQWTLMAVVFDTGERLRSSDPSTLGSVALTPGSLLKLFTTAAALESNSRKPIDLTSVISFCGQESKGTLHGDVIIRGVGNPFLTAKDILTGIKKIKALGIEEIAGDVIVDASLIDVRGRQNKYNGPAYGVPSALGLDLHTVSITADPVSKKVIIEPPNDSVRVNFNASGKSSIRQVDDLTYEVTAAALYASTIRKRFSLAEPALYAGGTFLTLLKEQGIKVSGSVKRGVLSADAREIARVGSQDVDAFIRDTNMESLNVAADNLLFLLGAWTFGTPGTREKGIQAVNDFLLNMGVPLAGLVVDDGSGISDKNRITADQMITFLRSAATKPWFRTFYDSLSRPGKDGRLKDFGYRSDRIRMKSGQVKDAYGLAGYVDQKDGGKVAFVFIVNGPDANTPVVSTTAVEVLKQLEQ